MMLSLSIGTLTVIHKEPNDSKKSQEGSNLDKDSHETLSDLIADPRTRGDILDSIVKHHSQNEELMEQLVSHPKVMPQTLLYLFTNASAKLKSRLQHSKIKGDSSEQTAKEVVSVQGQSSTHVHVEAKKKKQKGHLITEENLYQTVQNMTVAEKVRLAFRASKGVRSLLLKDSNPQVSMAVLNSPKITEEEILMIAQSRNVSDVILREVGNKKDWIKNYQILFALVENPKTPLPISMPLLNSVKAKDLLALSKSRNVPEAIRTGASRLLNQKKKRT